MPPSAPRNDDGTLAADHTEDPKPHSTGLKEHSESSPIDSALETVPPRKQKKDRLGALRPFVIISSSYLLYTITDGAVRMIVLFHAYSKGFTALDVAIMFTLYEVAGVFTNLAAGVMGSRWGIKATLLTGLVLQLAGIGMLYAWQSSWSKQTAIIYVTLAQALCGVAKDLTKLGGKTVTKLVTPDEKQSKLFRLVSFITGFKNSLKGVGYFLGSVTVSVSYYLALTILMGLIVAAMPWVIVGLDRKLGRSVGKAVKFKDVFKMNYNINMLSAARMFLFGSRDAWFEVPLPFYLRDDVDGLGWSRSLAGLFLAVFIIVYGQVQSWSPRLVLQPLNQAPANKFVELLWASVLFVLPFVLGTTILASDIFQDRDISGMTAILVVGIGIFCVLFAINSAVHSYLVLRYAPGDKVAVNVGFYYMSNAMGRLTGTLLSGVFYTYVGSSATDGFGSCFILSAAFLIICIFLTSFIRDDEAGLLCGPWTCVKPQVVDSDEEDEDKAGSRRESQMDAAIASLATGPEVAAAGDKREATADLDSEWIEGAPRERGQGAREPGTERLWSADAAASRRVEAEAAAAAVGEACAGPGDTLGDSVDPLRVYGAVPSLEWGGEVDRVGDVTEGRFDTPKEVAAHDAFWVEGVAHGARPGRPRGVGEGAPDTGAVASQLDQMPSAWEGIDTVHARARQPHSATATPHSTRSVEFFNKVVRTQHGRDDVT